LLNVVEREEYVVLCPKGYLNGAMGKELVKMSERLARDGHERILIDFGSIETINTMGIASLVSVLEKVPRRGGKVCFCDLGASNRDVLDVLDISSAVLIFAHEAEAAAHWKRVEG